MLDRREENQEINEKGNGVAKTKHWGSRVDEEGSSYALSY